MSTPIKIPILDLKPAYDELRAEPTRASELAEELAVLLHEAKVISCSMLYFKEITEQLLTEPCHGPH